jgi:hypothetical protein
LASPQQLSQVFLTLPRHLATLVFVCQGWVLGDAFLNKYYAAFDFEKQRIGLALAADNAMDTCVADKDLDINYYWVQENYFVEDDPDDHEETITATTEEQDHLGNNHQIDNAVEIFDTDEDSSLPVGGGDEDFDFSDMTEESTVAPVKNNTAPTLSHNEPPEREPLPHLNGSSTGNVPDAVASLSQSQKDSSSHSGVVVMYIVLTVVITMIIAFVFRKTSRRRQQGMFQAAWNEAEKKIVDSHRNLNYRDHSSLQQQQSNTIVFGGPYRDGGCFHDEEQPNNLDFDEQEEHHRSNFVLDSNMLDRMN